MPLIRRKLEEWSLIDNSLSLEIRNSDLGFPNKVRLYGKSKTRSDGQETPQKFIKKN